MAPGRLGRAPVNVRVWCIFLCLWVATLTAFRRDPAWELYLEALVFLTLAASFLRDGPWRVPTVTWGLLAIAALALGQLALGATLAPAATVLALTRALALAAWGLIVQRELGEVRGRFLEMLVHSAAAFALLSLLMWSTSGGRLYWWWPTTQAEVLGPWVNRNHFAVWCELMLAPAICLACAQRKFWWAAMAIAAGGAASGSRAALALMALELVVLLVLLGRTRKDVWPTRARLAGAVLAFPLGMALLSGDHLWHKFRDPEPLLYRDQMWHSALRLWRTAPWIGHGLGTFERAYPAVATFDTGERIDHAHNDWLEGGAEGGVVLVTLLAAGFVYATRLTRLTPWLAGVPIAGLHALVDYPLARFPMWLWLITFMILASFEGQRFNLKQLSRKRRCHDSTPHIIGASVPHRTSVLSPNSR